MYKIIIDTMLNLYDQFVDYKDNFKRNEGIYFIVKLDGESSGFEKDGNTCHPEWQIRVIKYFHIIFLSNRNVFICISDTEKMPKPNDWVNTSNHESCFRTDGVRDLINLYFEINNQIFEKTDEEHREPPIMGNVELSLHHGWIHGPVFKFVEVEKERLADGYHSKLVSINEIQKTITF